MNSKTKASQRPKLLPITEEMKQWSAMLGKELTSWPGVASKPMFGFRGFYRKRVIFAALPVSRALHSPSAIIFKFKLMSPALLQRAKKDLRMDASTRAPGAGWFSFELNSSIDLRDALWWLNHAYEAAKA